MYSNLIKYCSEFIEINEEDKILIKNHFHKLSLNKKALLLEVGNVCDFIAYIDSGIIRGYHIKDGNEITCDIILHNSFLTDFNSFTNSIPSSYSFQALQKAELLIIGRKDILKIYEENRKFETLGRLMAEKTAQRAIEKTMILAYSKPEERVQKLLEQQPLLFQLVPQRHLANMLGITPESFSRIRVRR